MYHRHQNDSGYNYAACKPCTISTIAKSLEHVTHLVLNWTFSPILCVRWGVPACTLQLLPFPTPQQLCEKSPLMITWVTYSKDAFKTWKYSKFLFSWMLLFTSSFIKNNSWTHKYAVRPQDRDFTNYKQILENYTPVWFSPQIFTHFALTAKSNLVLKKPRVVETEHKNNSLQ
jgi:hypothetical protein